jgi:hypothetical protein
MTDPKISFGNLPGDKELDLDLDGGAGASAKKEPKMKWEMDAPVFNTVAKNDPHPVSLDLKSMEYKEKTQPVVEFNEKEALLKELLKEKDKTIEAMKEIIDVQRKLIEQLQENRS